MPNIAMDFVWRTGEEGIRQNRTEAATYFKLAADQNLVNSEYRYGLCLANGEGMPQNQDEALR
jgi:TPR repeat protein